MLAATAMAVPPPPPPPPAAIAVHKIAPQRLCNGTETIFELWRQTPFASDRPVSKATMAGIARGRLMEERKQWRKDHPHVRASDLCGSSGGR